MRNGDENRIGFLYFIHSPTQGAIKIGFAEQVYSRVKTLQTGNPAELVLLGCVPCFAEAEILVHKLLLHKRIRLEWYPDDDEIDRFLTELQDDMFDAGIQDLDLPDSLGMDAISELLGASYVARPLPTDLILQRAREFVCAKVA